MGKLKEANIRVSESRLGDFKAALENSQVGELGRDYDLQA
jgi:hypothetical protein